MLSHYSTIRAQLALDVAAALGPGGRVSFGLLVKPKGAARYGVVLTSVERANVVRQVQESWAFTIAVMVPLSEISGATDVEEVLYGIAGDLVAVLAPYDPADVPASAGSYAGVASRRRVTKVDRLELKDTDSHAGVVVEFSCETTVYQ